MANPRKFSEKIALQKQKEAEGTAEFERIMKEVSVATAKVDETKVISTIGKSHRESRGRSVGGGPIRRPSERKVDTSPYSSNVAYLSPPSDSYWRRASSDSAIHQSLVMGNDNKTNMRSSGNFSSQNSKYSTNIVHQCQKNDIMDPHRNSSGIDIRQGSNHLLISQFGPNVDSQMSSGIGNTGSLPDLTSVHYASQVPIKQHIYNKEQQQETCNSAYSSSPVASPTMLSPNSAQQRYHSPVHSPVDNSNAYSPTHSGSRVEKETNVSYQQQSPLGQTSHLSFTNLPGLFHGSQKNMHDNNVMHGSHGHLTTVGMGNNSNLTEYRNPQQRPSPGSSPVILNSIQGNSDTALNSPCSPMSDPKISQASDTFQNQEAYNLNQSFQNQFSLDWPTLLKSLVDNGCTWTAQVQVDNRKVESLSNINTAQHNYQNMQYDQNSYGQYAPNMDNVSTNYNPHNNMNQYDLQLNNQYQQDVNNTNLDDDISRKNFSDIRLMQDKNNYSSPRTPTTIPEIVFSDFSTSTDYSREIFDTLDLGQLELGQMDVTGLQMLTDPNMITDPMIEDSFRRDLN